MKISRATCLATLTLALFGASCRRAIDAAPADASVESRFEDDGGLLPCLEWPEATLGTCVDGCDNDATGTFDCDDVKCCTIRSDCPAETLCGARGEGAGFDQALDLDDQRTSTLDPSLLPAGPDPCREPVLVQVTGVIDGDTIEVLEVDGSIYERVRFIGIDTPELFTEDTPECFATEAHEFANAFYLRTLWLTFDSECLGPYGRTLAYLHFGPGTNDMLQRHLLRRGLARAKGYGENRTFEALFNSDENIARGESIGLWGACP